MSELPNLNEPHHILPPIRGFEFADLNNPETWDRMREMDPFQGIQEPEVWKMLSSAHEASYNVIFTSKLAGYGIIGARSILRPTDPEDPNSPLVRKFIWVSPVQAPWLGVAPGTTYKVIEKNDIISEEDFPHGEIMICRKPYYENMRMILPYPEFFCPARGTNHVMFESAATAL